MYLPLAIFFVWVEEVTWAMTAKLTAERAQLTADGAAPASTSELVATDV